MKRVALFLSFVLVVGVFVSAFGTPSLEQRIEAMENAAARIALLQDPLTKEWEWAIPDTSVGYTGGSTYNNLTGVTNIGLLGAAIATGDDDLLKLARDTMDVIVSGNPNPGDLYNGTNAYADFFACSAILADMGFTEYRDYALGQWQWIRQHISKYGSGNLETYYQAAFNHVAGYDAAYGAGTQDGYATWIAARSGWAALLLGDQSYAEEMASVVANHIGALNPDTGWYYSLGWGQALLFLSSVDPDQYASQISTMVAELAASQESTGSWEWGDIQGTSYGAVGLSTVDQLGLTEDAIKWLLSLQNENGGWTSYGDEYPEVDSEALQALVAYDFALFTESAASYGLNQFEAFSILVSVGLFDGYSLLPYFGLGGDASEAVVALALTEEYGLSPESAMEFVDQYGEIRVLLALLHSRGDYHKFNLMLGGLTWIGYLDDKTITPEQGLSLTFQLVDPYTFEAMNDIAVTFEVIRPGEIVVPLDLVAYDPVAGWFVLNLDTSSLEAGIYTVCLKAVGYGTIKTLTLTIVNE